MLAADGTPVQAGIASWGTATCNARVPQAFTRVSATAGASSNGNHPFFDYSSMADAPE